MTDAPTPDGYRKGPVLLRGGQVPTTTTDQRLLARGEGADWVHADPWRVMRIQSEFVEGFGALAEVGPAVSVFGSARTRRDDPVYATARHVGPGPGRGGLRRDDRRRPGRDGGGQPGRQRGRRAVGGPRHRAAARAGHERVGRPRRALPLLLRAQDDVRQVRPGLHRAARRFGTFDELFESVTLVQTQKVTEFPIVLIGTAYWSGLLDWLAGPVLAAGTISAHDLDLLHVTDDPDEAVAVVRERDAQLQAAEAQAAPTVVDPY